MALVLLVTTLAVQTVFSQQDIPYCLQTCLTEVGTTLCATHALHELTPCLAKTCSNPSATQNIIASLGVAFSPKAEYSCQQAYGPSSSAASEASSVTLPFNGTCATSPYEFKSYLPQGVSNIRASVGCGIITFSDEDCLGEAGSSDVGTLSNGKCVFRGGRSARLTCRNELDAARAYMQTNCGTDGEDEDEPAASSSSSKTIYPSSAPFHGPGPTSPGTGTSSSIPFHWSFSSDSNSASAISSSPSTMTSIPFHWPFSPSSGSLASSASSPAATNTADAAGSSKNAVNDTATTYSPTVSASASASLCGNGSAFSGGSSNSSTSPSGISQNVTYTLSVTPTVDPTTPPSYAGLAAQFGSGSSGCAAIALVGAGFALFL